MLVLSSHAKNGVRRLVIDSERLSSGGTVALTPDEWRYLARVLRLVVGAELEVRDGAGGSYLGTLSPGRTIQLGERSELPPMSGIAVHLAFSPPRGRRLDWLLEKAAELGAHTLWPVWTERGVRKETLSLARWSRKLSEAARQCGAAHAPVLEPARDLPDLIATLPVGLVRVLAQPTSSERLDQIVSCSGGNVPKGAVVLTGPEGGFTEKEEAAALDSGFVGFGMGDNILRAETAPLAALTILRHRCGEL